MITFADVSAMVGRNRAAEPSQEAISYWYQVEDYFRKSPYNIDTLAGLLREYFNGRYDVMQLYVVVFALFHVTDSQHLFIGFQRFLPRSWRTANLDWLDSDIREALKTERHWKDLCNYIGVPSYKVSVARPSAGGIAPTPYNNNNNIRPLTVVSEAPFSQSHTLHHASPATWKQPVSTHQYSSTNAIAHDTHLEKPQSNPSTRINRIKMVDTGQPTPIPASNPFQTMPGQARHAKYPFKIKFKPSNIPAPPIRPVQGSVSDNDSKRYKESHTAFEKVSCPNTTFLHPTKKYHPLISAPEYSPLSPPSEGRTSMAPLTSFMSQFSSAGGDSLGEATPNIATVGKPSPIPAAHVGEGKTKTATQRVPSAVEIAHVALYPSRRDVLLRKSKPYIHAACGLGFTHPENVKAHHRGRTGRPRCRGPNKTDDRPWNAHPSCKVEMRDLDTMCVKEGVVLLDSQSLDRINAAVAAGLGHGEGGVSKSKNTSANVEEGYAAMRDASQDTDQTVTGEVQTSGNITETADRSGKLADTAMAPILFKTLNKAARDLGL